ncbi:MAG: hypothetical protein DWQ06_15050 [Calditrichaeota bacterium]|nr:MAG: hypothetical protein DWQ06_15050 [Calditrichota bacterium]
MNKSKLTLLITLATPLFVFGQTKPESLINFYGYLSTNYEDLSSITRPSAVDTIETENFNPVSGWEHKDFHLLFQSIISDKFKAFGHLSVNDAEEIELRNYWGEFTASEKFKISGGKIYRPFGLYNETLDASASFVGIDAPEYLDENHPIVPRTTTLLFHGGGNLERNHFRYAISFDSGEQNDGTALAYGWDVSNEFYDIFKVGYSFYRTEEKRGPKNKIGEGSPEGGVLPWVANEKYFVWGGYLQADYWNFTLQSAWWKANHKGQRSQEQLQILKDSAALNDFQRVRFFGTSENTFNLDFDYAVKTWFTKIYYTWDSEKTGQWIPYYNFEFYQNPETISEVEFGGDDKAGNSDGGKFNKHTFGFSYKPNSKIAFKTDVSTYRYTLDTKKEHFNAFRIQFAYTF